MYKHPMEPFFPTQTLQRHEKDKEVRAKIFGNTRTPEQPLLHMQYWESKNHVINLVVGLR